MTTTIATDNGREFERELEMRRQVLMRVVKSLDDASIRTASDALRDLLEDASEEMAMELLGPIFEWSEFWPQQIAAELLGLPDDEYTCAELLDEFEQRKDRET